MTLLQDLRARITRITGRVQRRHLMMGFSVVVMKVASVGVGLVASIVVARVLGPSDFGIYSFVFAMVAVATVPVQLGLPTLVVRETARSQAVEDWSAMRALWRWAGTGAAIASLVLACAGLAAVYLVGGISSEMRSTVIFGLLLVPLAALGGLRGAALRGLRHPILGDLPERIVRPLGLIALAGAAAWFGFDQIRTPSGIMALHAIAAGIAFIVGAVTLLALTPPQLSSAGGRQPELSGEWIRAVIPLALTAGLQVLNANVGVLVLGVLQTPEHVGLFKVVATASSIVAVGLPIFETIAAPYMARFHALGDRQRLEELARVGALGAFGLSVPIFAILLLWGQDLLRLFYGEQYAASYVPLVIVVGAQALNAAIGPNMMMLSMTGHQQDTLVPSLLATVGNVLLAAALVPALGATGAAIALGTTTILASLLISRQVRQRLGLRSSLLSLWKAQ